LLDVCSHVQAIAFVCGRVENAKPTIFTDHTMTDQTNWKKILADLKTRTLAIVMFSRYAG